MTSNYGQKILLLTACNDTNLAMCFMTIPRTDLDFGFCERVGLTDCDYALKKAGSGESERGPVGVKNAKFVSLNLLVANYWQMRNGNVDIITFQEEASF